MAGGLYFYSMKQSHLILTFMGLLSLVSTQAAAQTNISNGVPVTIPVDAEMDNNFAVDVTDIDFGTIGATNAVGEIGELIMAPDGSLDETSGNTDPVARIVSSGGPSTPGILDIEGALTDTLVYIRYSNVQNLTCGACGGTPPELIISRITDDAADQAGLWSVDDADPDGDAVAGQVTTSGTGTALVNIGATLRTDGSGTPYPSGTYAGSVDVTLEY